MIPKALLALSLIGQLIQPSHIELLDAGWRTVGPTSVKSAIVGDYRVRDLAAWQRKDFVSKYLDEVKYRHCVGEAFVVARFLVLNLSLPECRHELSISDLRQSLNTTDARVDEVIAPAKSTTLGCRYVRFHGHNARLRTDWRLLDSRKYPFEVIRELRFFTKSG